MNLKSATGTELEGCDSNGERARLGRSGLRPRGPHWPAESPNRLVCLGLRLFGAGRTDSSRGGCAPHSLRLRVSAVN